jgi:hypothetical protein
VISYEFEYPKCCLRSYGWFVVVFKQSHTFKSTKRYIGNGVFFAMYTSKTKAIFAILIVTALITTSGFGTVSYAQVTSQICEQCGMVMDATGAARFSIVDSSGGQHIACCPVCALKMIKTYGELTITSFCDYKGPTYPITITAKQHGSVLTVSPQSALVIVAGGCTKNRLVHDYAAADALLASPDNGTSKWLSPLTNDSITNNPTRLSVAQAVLQYGGGETSVCEQCGMTVDVTGQARFKIFDATGTLHIACCPICALKLQRTYNDLNITAFCDYYGPNYPIFINSRNNGTAVTVSPPDALVIVAGSCTKNRIVYNSTAADALLAPPNNGTSKWLSMMTNDTVAENATRMSVVQAALINGAGLPSSIPSPSPSASSTPLASASPTATQTPEPTPTNGGILECEVCGMDVTPESQARYRVTDGTGQVHYVECFMCAMQLINDYETLHIETYCDWYGPNYPITIDTSNYGAQVTVNPSTAMFLRGGSCVTARVAYNQTAADNLLRNGFSQYTSPEQLYALPSTTQIKLVSDAISAWYAKADATGPPTTLMLALIFVVGVATIGGSIVAYKKLKS